MDYKIPRNIEVNLPDFDPSWIIKGITALLIGWALLTSFYTVPADSEGAVLRFGKYLTSEQPGLHFKMPFGIDRVFSVPVKRQLKLEFGFSTENATNPDQPAREPEGEKGMVSGDLNSALVEWVVQYRVDDTKLFLFHTSEP